MSEKSKLEQYVDDINAHILPFIDYDRLQTSYDTDMDYAKGVLNRLHEAMKNAYGGERLGEWDGDEGFVMIPGIVRGRENGNMCIALLDLDLSSSGEHWGTSFLCKYGVIPQTGADTDNGNNSALVSHMRELSAAFVPYDYCYTAALPDDIHVRHATLPADLKAVLDDFRSHRALLLNEEKPSVMGRMREAAKEPTQPAEPNEKTKKPGPEL